METVLIILIIFILFEIPTCIGMGLIFQKMNIEFKKGIIPFYNKILLIKKYKLPQYHLILIFIPIIGIYTNYVIYEKICKEYNKDFLYLLELTFFPFVYNIFLGLELKQKEEIVENTNKIEPEKKDEYTWQPRARIKSNTVYKATRNNLNEKVDIQINKNEIINNKITTNQKEKKDTKPCPNCGTKVSNNAETCFVCGTKL